MSRRCPTRRPGVHDEQAVWQPIVDRLRVLCADAAELLEDQRCMLRDLAEMRTQLGPEEATP